MKSVAEIKERIEALRRVMVLPWIEPEDRQVAEAAANQLLWVIGEPEISLTK